MAAFKDGDHYHQLHLIYTLGASVYRSSDFGFSKVVIVQWNTSQFRLRIKFCSTSSVLLQNGLKLSNQTSFSNFRGTSFGYFAITDKYMDSFKVRWNLRGQVNYLQISMWSLLSYLLPISQNWMPTSNSSPGTCLSATFSQSFSLWWLKELTNLKCMEQS